MKKVPNYYKYFKCTADKCAHSCCKGWEIDIDKKSLARYEKMPGAIGEKLRQSIEYLDGEAHFRLDKDERCPFLQPDGLCELIISCGEGSLCNICTDHPRFRSIFYGYVETGLGLCCEECARLILTFPEKFRLESSDEKGSRRAHELTALLEKREHLINILTDRSKSVSERIKHYCESAGIERSEPSVSDWCRFYASLEIMDRAWSMLLEREKASSPPPDRDSPDLELAFEQLAVYFLFRHYLQSYYDGREAERLMLSVHALMFIRALLYATGEASITRLIDIARLYSAEIEYSAENLTALFDRLYVAPEAAPKL